MKRISYLPFKDFTGEFFKSILFDPKELFMGANYNRIKQISIIIQGSVGIGKTTLAECIIKKISDYYGKDNVNTVYTNEVSLGGFIEIAFGLPCRPQWNPKKPIQVLVFDDATCVKINPAEHRMFFSLRHLMKEKTGLNEGVLYSIFLTHQWYGLDTKFRRSCTRVIFLSTNTIDKYALGEYRRVIGRDGVQELNDLYYKAEKEDKYKGKGLVTLPYNLGDRNVGYIHWKPVQLKYWKITKRFRDLPPEINTGNLEIKIFEKPMAISKAVSNRPPCPDCGANDITSQGKQWHCKDCGTWFLKIKRNKGMTR